jgi:NAD(P)-dependent dehydrogenase (short-subunit alcohol dehydrogenase family)
MSEMTTYNLTGRSALITGANQGLGREIAGHFVRAGANVLLTARNVELLEQARAELQSHARPSQKVLAMRNDVASRESCDAVAAFAAKEFPTLEILVNNAGIYGPKGPIEEVNWDEWIQAIEINLFGTVYMCRALIPHFKSRRYGKIVNLSGGGATAPLPRISAYAASKAAVVRMTETLAEELRDWKIDVNAIAPGALNTRLLDEVLSAGPEKVGKAFYERSLKQRDDGGAPLDKGAALSVFLASAESDGITGKLLSAVWDDWQNLPARREQLAKSDVFTLRRIVPEDRGMK